MRCIRKGSGTMSVIKQDGKYEWLPKYMRDRLAEMLPSPPKAGTVTATLHVYGAERVALRPRGEDVIASAVDDALEYAEPNDTVEYRVFDGDDDSIVVYSVALTRLTDDDVSWGFAFSAWVFAYEEGESRTTGCLRILRPTSTE
jgi:hypothetical protein